MKLLWVNSIFLHPTTKGGQIRTLEMLRCLHRRHEIHYVAIENPDEPEGLARAGEYCTRAWPVRMNVVPKNSPAFFLQLTKGWFSSLPVTIERFRSPAAGALIGQLLEREHFDRAVCDFLAPSVHYPDLPRVVLFQHNVETMIWRRTAEHAKDPLRRAYLNLQAQRMFAYERDVCRKVAHTVAVSEADAEMMRSMFGVSNVSPIPTGVDIDYFNPKPAPAAADLVFVGSMDWRPNVDGVLWFVEEILPLLWKQRPDCSLAVVGRNPPPEIVALGQTDNRIRVTGTVPDVRPYLWGSKLSIVPLRIGGGTRLKVYESMAAKTAVVSTTVGAEGLLYHDGSDIAIVDEPAAFAGACAVLLNDDVRRHQMAQAAWTMVADQFSWDEVARRFEDILLQAAPASDVAGAIR